MTTNDDLLATASYNRKQARRFRSIRHGLPRNIRRECLARVGGFDPAIRLMEDAEFYIRVMRECGARFIGQTAVNFRIGSSLLMHSPTPDRSQCLMAHAGHRQAQAKYRKEHGLIEFLSLALFTKTVLRVLAHCDWLILY